MARETDTNSNQTPKTINLPDQSEGVENPPGSGEQDQPGQKPDEHVPPVEIPAEPSTPGPVPEKSRLNGLG